MKEEINPQRKRNFWEPIYEPNISSFEKWKITAEELRHLKGIQKLVVDLATIQETNFTHLNDFTFEKIDFSGTLDGDQIKFTFRNCKFTKCSFRNAEFKNIKFTNCIFSYTTFALGYFKNCEFRNCRFNKIGVSGNSMVFEDCYINPEHFLKDLFLNTNAAVLREFQTNVAFQSYQQTKTKSVIARKLTESLPIKNDIEYHILSIKIARKYEILAFMKEAIYYLTHGKFSDKLTNFFNLLYSLFEMPVIMLFGWLSGWGYKIGKTLTIGILSILLFTILNKSIIFKCDTFSDSLLKTVEYWLLFGYTKYDFNLIPSNLQWIILLNSIFGMIWFAALIPIIINKLGKSNE